MKKVLVPLAIAFLTLCLCLAGLEYYLRSDGFGYPPLYESDPAVGYLLKPSQSLTRTNGCRVIINGLGMRSPGTTRNKPKGVSRVLVLGDSVPYGGSYIDQDDIFTSVAERLLNSDGKRYEVLNAGVNALGPRNISAYVRTRGVYQSDMVIIYFPWGNLRRGWTNFYIVPFWSNSPRWALAEYFRQGCWMIFGRLSQRWKDLNAFKNDRNLELNLKALQEVRGYCDKLDTPVYFFWSPGLSNFYQETDKLDNDRKAFRERFPREVRVDMKPILAAAGDPRKLYKDSVHYSREGHLVVGRYLAAFISTRLE
jgi:hypothetical protein